MNKNKILAILGALMALWGGVTMPLDAISPVHLLVLVLGIILFASNSTKVFFGDKSHE